MTSPNCDHLGHYSVPVAPEDRLPLEGESIRGPRAKADYKIDPETGCWVWLKAVDRNGYAAGKMYRRYWERANGRKLERGEHIHHVCRNRACVNPEHLEAVDAIAHAIEHKLGARGQTIQDIIDIREAGKDPTITQYDLAAKYGITPNNIWYIWTARSWGHLGGPVRPEGVLCKECGAEVDNSLRRHKQYCDDRCMKRFNAKKPANKARRADYQRRRRQEMRDAA